MITEIKYLTKKQKQLADGLIRMFDKTTLCNTARINQEHYDWSYVYLLDNKPVGILLFVNDADNEYGIKIGCLVVSKKYRNCGIGTMLRQHLLNNYCNYHIKTYAKEKYKSYYESFGFVMSEIGVAFPEDNCKLKKYELKIFTKQPN